MTGNIGAVRIGFQMETAMKTIVTVLIAAPASALDTKTFWEQQERQSH
jgi:hypothetical protein